MKLNKEEEKILIDWGYSQENIQQIKELRYKFTLCQKNGMEEKISLEKAKNILSKQDFLSGIGRASFHCSAIRDTENGKVYIVHL